MLRFRQFLKEANLQDEEKEKIKNFLNSMEFHGKKNIKDWLDSIAFNFIANKSNSSNSDFVRHSR